MGHHPDPVEPDQRPLPDRQRSSGANSTSATLTVFGRGAAPAGASSERQDEGRERDRDECPLHGQWFLLFGFAFTRTEPRMNGWIRQKYVYVFPALRSGGVLYWLEPVVTSWLRPVP